MVRLEVQSPTCEIEISPALLWVAYMLGINVTKRMSKKRPL